MASSKLKDSSNGSATNDKDKAVDLALAQIEKQFGKGSIMRLGESQVVDVDVIPTGSLSLDAALGIGGIPRGRIVELFGPEAAGKTMCALHMVAEAQKRGGVAAFVDAEHALDVNFARKLGVDVDNLLVAQPDSGEEALEITDTLVRSGAVDVLVVDSIPQSKSRGEIAKATEAGAVGEDAVTELGNVIQDPSKGRTSDDQTTIADLTGVAVQDIQISKAVYKAVSG